MLNYIQLVVLEEAGILSKAHNSAAWPKRVVGAPIVCVQCARVSHCGSTFIYQLGNWRFSVRLGQWQIMFSTISIDTFQTLELKKVPVLVQLPLSRKSRFCGVKSRSVNGCLTCRRRKYVHHISAFNTLLTQQETL